MTTESTERALPLNAHVFRPGGWNARLVGTLIVLLLAGELSGLAYLYPVSALPVIGQYFQTDQLAWVITAHSLAGGVSAALIGKLADNFGKKRVILVVMGVTVVGLTLGTWAPSFGVLLVGRVLTGPCLAVVFLIPSLLRDVFPTKTLPLATSVGTSGSGGFAIIAALLVGAIITSFGFRGTFWIPAVFGVVVMVLVALVVPEGRRSDQRESLDVAGALLLGIGVAAILLGVSLGQSLGWTSPTILGTLIGGVAVIVVWFIRSLRITRPLIDLRLLANPPAAVMLGLSALGIGALVWFYTLVSLVPTSKGDGWGLGLGPAAVAPFTAILLASGLVTSFIAGRALLRFTVAPVAMVSAALIIVGYLVAFVGLTSVPLFVIGSILVGASQGFTFAVTYNLVVLVVAPQYQATTASVVSLCANFGSAVSSVLIFAFMNAQAQTTPGLYGHTAMVGATLLPAAMGVAALLLSLVLIGRRSLQPGLTS